MTVAADDVTAIVLAGGRGTRIQAIHPALPKPMAPVAGKPFLHWLTLWLARHGVRHFVYSTGYRGDAIDEWVRRPDDFPGSVRECRREAEPLGTGGGLFNCLDLCRRWVLVVNGDGLVLDGIAALLAWRQAPDVAGGLLGVEVDDTSRYGSLETDADGCLAGFFEKRPGRGIVNGGVYLLRRDTLAAARSPGACSIEYDVIPQMLAVGVRLKVVRAGMDSFIDIGTPETLREADHFVRTRLLDR